MFLYYHVEKKNPKILTAGIVDLSFGFYMKVMAHFQTEGTQAWAVNTFPVAWATFTEYCKNAIWMATCIVIPYFVSLLMIALSGQFFST